MNAISYQQLKTLCATKKVIHALSGLRADANLGDIYKHCPIQVGSDNDKKSFDISETTFSEIVSDGKTVKGKFNPDYLNDGGFWVEFSIEEWKK